MMLTRIFIFSIGLVLAVNGLPAVTVPKYLAIYYGWPSLVQNSQGNLTKAIDWFKKFDLIVFADALLNSAHLDYNNTITIITSLRASQKKVFGYVDLGVTKQNLSLAQMYRAVDTWYGMGATGIFWDDAGYDYGVTRCRQSTMVQYCHSKGMNVIMNAWNPDDVMGGTDVQLNSNDIYLLESYLVANGSYTSLTAWEAKAKKCANYKNTLGVQMACLSTGNTYEQFTQAWFGTVAYNFDYFQNTEIQYSAVSCILNFNANPSSSYGTTWQTNDVLSDTTKTNFTRSTESWKVLVTGNGASWGYGTFLANP